MHDSRKTLLNVLIDNLFNVCNIATAVLLIVFIINKSFVYMIPLVLSLLVSIFNLVLEFKHYVLFSRNNQRLNVLKDGKEHEKTFVGLKVGDEVVLYPNETINFVGVVKGGYLLVDESPLNGTTKLVKKETGSSVTKGTKVVEGHAVVEVKELSNKVAKTTIVKQTKLYKRIRILNLIFSCATLIIVLLGLIIDKISLDNVSKSAIAALPCLINIVLSIYFFVLSHKQKEDIAVFDHAVLSELLDVDVVCLDKTGTITTGEYEIFKTVIISQSSLSSVSLNSERAFEQIVSNIIKTTKEKNGYYSTLQKHFVYDVSKIIDESSPVSRNGLYSAITVKGGNTYALGEPENFELSNYESASSLINEYESSGYRVLVLVESKNPLKNGLIDGKSFAIGLIVLQETIRENIKQLISFCLEKGKQVKVISGDRIATVCEIARKAGVENLGKATSVKLVPFEKIELLLEEDVVFADATPSQKAFIVKQLQKNGHTVAFIGDGDNDTQALKAANVSISMNNGTQSVKKCSHASISDSFDFDNGFVNKCKSFKGKLDSVTALLYSTTAFSLFYLLAFMVAGLFNQTIKNPFEYNHLLMWLLFGILIPVILLLIDKNDNLKQKSFLRNFISASLLLIAPIGVMYILQLLQYYSVGYFGLASDLNDMHETLITSSVVNNLSYLALIVLSLVTAYNHYSPFNKFRVISFLSILLIPIVYAILLACNVDEVSSIVQIDSHQLTPINYFVMGVSILACSAVYLLVLDIISIIKGENQNVKSKSKN